jgi:prevent-host-death family protein
VTHLSISEARNQLTRLAGRLRPRGETVEVTSRGKPILAILPWDLYESMVETMEIMADQDLMEQVRRGIKECRAGKGIPLDEAKKRLGL